MEEEIKLKPVVRLNFHDISIKTPAGEGHIGFNYVELEKGESFIHRLRDQGIECEIKLKGCE